MENKTINQLISEIHMAEALGMSRSTLYGLRRKGLPWISLGGRAYFYEPTFMEWILEHQKRMADVKTQSTTA